MIELPADTCDCGYTQVWINFRASARQAAALKVLWCSLRRRHERFHAGGSSHPDGAPVEGPTHGLRWLLDRLADAIETDTGRDLLKDFDMQF